MRLAPGFEPLINLWKNLNERLPTRRKIKMTKGDQSWHFDNLDKTSPLCTEINYQLSTKIYMRYPNIDWAGMNLWASYTPWNGRYRQQESGFGMFGGGNLDEYNAQLDLVRNDR